MDVTIRALLVMTALTACTSGPQARYICGDAAVTATFTGQDRARVTVGADAYSLSRALSGSGARYEGGADDGAVEFWEHQGTARLTVGPTVYPECRPEPVER